MAKIREANATIVKAMADGKNVTEAQALLASAIAAYSDCSYTDAEKFADSAINNLKAPVGLIALGSAVLLIVLAYLGYWALRNRVKPKLKRKNI